MEALKFYRLAAEQGYAPAEASFGVMYAQGRGVPQDYAEAVKWYRLAVEQRHSYAQLNLGHMCAKGQGVLQDSVEAYKRASLAAAQGDKNAISRLKFLSSKMNPAQIAEAKRLAREWLEQHRK